MNQSIRENDIPASVAVVALMGLGGAWLYFKAPATVAAALNELDSYAEAHLIFLAILLFATTINCVWVYSVFARSFGINRQGQRLEILAKENSKKRTKVRVAWIAAGLSALALPGIYFLVRFVAVAQFPTFVPQQFFGPIWLVLAINMGFSVFVCLAAMERGGILERLTSGSGVKLPEIPKPQNAIVLGAVEEVAVSA